MDMTTYYGMDSNPFEKDIDTTKLYASNDLKQMTNRLEFIIRSRGIGVFMSNPGMGKTTCLRKTLQSLNPNRYIIIYICLTTITAMDFYRMLNEKLGLEATNQKSRLFTQIQEELKRLTSENKKEVIIAIDEAQFLGKEVLPTDENNNILQKTEKIIGPYELHDFFLYHFMKNNLSFEKIKFLALNGFNGIYNEKLIEASLNVFIKKFFQNQFKRSSMPDGPKITEISLSPRGDLKMSSDSSYNSFI